MKKTSSRLFFGLIALLAVCAATAAEYPARLDWERSVELSTPVSGVITKVPVRPGQKVGKGELLVELDQRLFRARLQRAEAELKKHRHEHDEAVREYERTQELYDRTLLSEHDRQVVEIAMVTAESDFISAKSAVTEARVRLEYSRLRAPFEALVTAVQAVPGETLVSRLQARPLVTLVPARRLRASTKLDSAQLRTVDIGMDASVSIADKDYPARVTSISATDGVPAAYRLDVTFELPADSTLRPGQTANIRLEDKP